MVDREWDIRPIGYGAMLIEGVVGVVAIITACALHPADYYAISTTPEVFQKLGMTVVNLPELQSEVGETVAGRPGGAVALAVGMAQIFSVLPGIRGLMAYWYHFAIMFEALFILTTIDSGTRIGRFLVQEFGGRVWKPLARTDWLPGSLIDVRDRGRMDLFHLDREHPAMIWPMFGVANQLLAVVALAVGTTIIVSIGPQVRLGHVPAALLHQCHDADGGIHEACRDNSGPMAIGDNPALHMQATMQSICTVIMLVCAVIILFSPRRGAACVLGGTGVSDIRTDRRRRAGRCWPRAPSPECRSTPSPA